MPAIVRGNTIADAKFARLARPTTSLQNSVANAKAWQSHDGETPSIRIDTAPCTATLLSSLAAREVIVGTLASLYGMEGQKDTAGLQHALAADMTLGGAVALLVFFAFAMQCMSTLAIVRRETGGWKWPALQFTYMTVLAYVCAFAANHLIS